MLKPQDYVDVQFNMLVLHDYVDDKFDYVEFAYQGEGLLVWVPQEYGEVRRFCERSMKMLKAHNYIQAERLVQHDYVHTILLMFVTQ